MIALSLETASVTALKAEMGLRGLQMTEFNLIMEEITLRVSLVSASPQPKSASPLKSS